MHPHTSPASSSSSIEPTTPQELFAALTTGWESTAPHPVTGERVVIHALLPALHEAIFGGMESTGGAAGFSPKMPIDSGALDLYQAIEQEIAEAWAGAFPNQIPGIESVEQLLTQFFAVTQRAPEAELVTIMRSVQRVDNPGTISEHWWVERLPTEYTPLALLRRWVAQVQGFFDPPSHREIMAPCVTCGDEWAWRHSGGEDKPYRVFVFEQDDRGNTLGARCLACDSRWGLGQMRELATRIADALVAVQRHDAPA